MHLICRDITFKYSETGQNIFKGLSFDISRPGLHALFGPSGVGKTSLAKIIAGDISDITGEIHIQGIDSLLYSYNTERLPGWSSVGRHLDKIIPRHMQSKKEALVEAFGLNLLLKSRFSQLSLGQQNRVNLLRYLLQDFQLLIMDESLANVDERTRERILLAMKAMFPYVIFLYISHNVVEVSKFCDQIFVLRGAHKTPQAVLIDGQNHRRDQPASRGGLQSTMLEIMNAA